MAPLFRTLFVFLIVVQNASAQSTFIPKNLGEAINSSYNEIHPVISPDKRILYFTRVNHPENLHGPKNSEDVWFSEMQVDGQWTTAKLQPALNVGKKNKVLSITADGEQLLLLHDDEFSLWHKTNNEWASPKKLYIKGTSNATLSDDGNLILYSKGGSLFKVEKQIDGNWTDATEIKGLEAKAIQHPHLTNDNKTLYFSSKRKGFDLDFFYAKRESDDLQDWSTPVALSDTINSKSAEYTISTTSNGAWAYFSSTVNSNGKSDIYCVKLYEDQPYVLVSGKIVNEKTKRALFNKKASIKINGQESKSFGIDKDSATYWVKLPFGKQYLISASINNYGEIPYSINTDGDKEFRTINMDIGQHPVDYAMVTGRLLIKNADKIIPASAKPQIVIDGEVVNSAKIDPTTGTYSLLLKHGALYYLQVSAKRFESFPEVVDLTKVDGYEEIVVDLQADAEKMAIVRGRIIDKARKPILKKLPLDVKVEGVSTLVASTDSLSNYEVRLPLRESHTISAEVAGHYPIYEIIDITNETKEVEINRDLVVVPIEVGQSIRLNNIFFEAGKTAINTASFPEMNRLVAFLNSHPEMKIEIGAHTDKSSKISTLTMAKNVVKYITSKGIAKNRITARGYSSTKPISTSKSPEAKALNNRIEFSILHK